MDRTRWIIFAGICVAIIAGLVYASSSNRTSVEDVNPFTITTNKEINDQTFGAKDAKVVIYEYADFQCPGCGGAYPNLKTIKDTYKDSVTFVYRHFPLTTIHPHAYAAAASAEAAGLQGKFWEMHDLLFDNQNAWSSLSAEQRQRAFEGYARQLNLNIDQFNADLTSDKVATKIDFDRALGRKLGVSSTPTIYVNDQKLSDDVVKDLIQANGEKLVAKLNTLIKESGGTVPNSQ